MREMLQSPRQHYARLTSLLRRIKDSPEASGELMRWGLSLDPDIYRVRAGEGGGGQAPSSPPGNGSNGCTAAALGLPRVSALFRPRAEFSPWRGSICGTALSSLPRT